MTSINFLLEEITSYHFTRKELYCGVGVVENLLVLKDSNISLFSTPFLALMNNTWSHLVAWQEGLKIQMQPNSW